MPLFRDVLARIFKRGGSRVAPLPRSVVTHDSVDRLKFDTFADDSPRFRHIVRDNRPIIEPDTQMPDEIDFTTASPDEVLEWQKKVRAAREAAAEAVAYTAWEDLTRDYFYLHHHAPPPRVLDEHEIDPEVSLHRRILDRIASQDDFVITRTNTREDATLS